MAVSMATIHEEASNSLSPWKLRTIKIRGHQLVISNSPSPTLIRINIINSILF